MRFLMRSHSQLAQYMPKNRIIHALELEELGELEELSANKLT